MKFCNQCGTKIDTDKKFCTECGAPLTNNDQSSVEKQIQSTPSNQPQPAKRASSKAPMSPKKKKKVIIIGSAVAVVLATVYFIGAYFTSQERLVDAFEDAVVEGDAEKIADLLSFRNQELKIANEDAEAFVKYLEANPEDGDVLVESVKKQSEAYKGNKANAEDEVLEFLVGGEESLVRLEQDGKFLFFDRYQLYIEPIYVQLHTEFQGTKLYKGDEELVEASSNDFSKEVGPFLPGIYTFSAEYKHEYMDVKEEQEVELTPYDNHSTINLSVNGGTVYFDSAFDDSVNSNVIINGESVDFNVFSDEAFGPVALDGSMEMAVQAEFPWGTMTTEAVALENDYFPIEFAMNDALQKSLVDAIATHYTSYMKALEKGDVALIENMSEDLMADFKNELDYRQVEDYIYTKETTKLEMDTDNFSLISTEDGLLSTVYLKETGKEGFYYQADDPQLTEEESYLIYELVYQDDNWVVTSKDGTWIDPSNFEQAVNIIEEPVSIKLDNSTETAEADDESDTEEALKEVYDSYLGGLIAAINNGDYSEVEPFIKAGSELETAQRDLVKRLSEKNIVEELQDYDFVGYETDGSYYVLDTTETIKINYQDGTSEVQDYQWKYTAVKDGDQYKLTTIEE
ncbi:zinc ribbon domain-containing protein [Virgibacillus senegalensis]|uniref:zinc ribbon domain-containing protein n=1 Tax=Virgibacillus senegalensis TaxID=1499679 RepID=UPI00069FAE62|nr:zinc-ribbon domain-containing protein [Virgibacillus senegalensis]